MAIFLIIHLALIIPAYYWLRWATKKKEGKYSWRWSDIVGWGIASVFIPYVVILLALLKTLDFVDYDVESPDPPKWL